MDKPSSGHDPKDWRGAAPTGQRADANYSWQTDDREAAPLHVRRASVKRRLRLLGMVLLTLTVSGVFLGELLFSQLRTPMIVIAPAAEYEFPFKPLSWSQEDLDGFRELDRETLDVHAVETGWKTKDQGLRQLDSQLQGLLNHRKLPECIVLYLRMYAAVDGAGIPCIVAPGSSPFNAESWIPVTDILERFRVQKIPNEIRKLVIFDCGGTLSDWHQGIVFNTFATRLPNAVQAANVPNLAVINSTGPTEISANSFELHRSIFGHYLKLGLAGAADAEYGNSDRIISVKELHRYLHEKVNAWSQANRNHTQQPQLLADESVDFEIVTVLNPRARTRAKNGTKATGGNSSAVSLDDVSALWKRFDACQTFRPFRFDPIDWTDFEQRLKWLECALESGEAYSRAARRTYQELQQRVGSVERAGSESDQERTLLARWATFSADPLLRQSVAKLNTVPLAEFFGTFGAANSENFQTILKQFTTAPSEATLRDTIQALTGNLEFARLELTCILRLWQRENVLHLWPDASILTSVIELHELGESASTPGDERTLEWIRPTVEHADRIRRKVDDQIFLGGEPPLNDISEARRFYNQAIHIAGEVSKAYEIRDRIDHELPYLAEWLLRPRFDARDLASDLLEKKAVILELMRNQRSLERALSHPLDLIQGELSHLPFQGLTNNIQPLYEKLHGTLVSEYQRLLQTEDAKPETWIDVRDLLCVPLLPPQNEHLALTPAQQRNLLREKLTTIDRRLHDQFVNSQGAAQKSRQVVAQTISRRANGSAGPANAQTRPNDTRMAEYLNQMLIEVPETLGLAIIRRDDVDNDDDDSNKLSNPQNPRVIHEIETIAENQGRLLRLWMNSVPGIVQSETEKELLSTEKRIFQNCIAEKIARSSATIAPVRFLNDPVEHRRRSDLQSLLLWHAHRVLNDFWAKPSADETSFFDTTAGNLMQMAEAIGRMPSNAQAEIAELGSLRRIYRQSAVDGLSTISDNLLLADDSEPAIAKVAVYESTKQKTSFPAGTAAVYVLGGEGERICKSHSLTIPWYDKAEDGSAAQFNVQLCGIEHRGEPMIFKAVTSFRGHDFMGDLTLNSMAGTVIDYHPNLNPQSRVTVRGRRSRKLSLVFVLDCSNSMGDELSMANDNLTGSRLQVAKVALQSMLDKLAESESHRVGLICFGHRIGWDLKQPGLYLRQPEYGAAIPDQIRPYDDVETILPLGRFNPSFAGAVAERLATIKPWGESPIYLALIQALRMFDTDEPDADRGIVVITDGTNYQFNPPAAARKSIYDVLATWNDHRVPIYIVGLGIGADQAAAAQKEFGELASKTNGSYVSAQEARTLAESLAALQRISDFRVRSLSDGQEQVAELGRPVTVEADLLSAKPFEVTMGNAAEQFSLSGAEAIEFVATRDERALDVLPYEIGHPQFIPLVHDDERNTQTGLVAGIHRPFRRGQKVTFEISVQHPQRHFVARPAEVWIEIVPIVRPGQPTIGTYLFYDANYVPNTSVPVLRWTVTDWPVDAVQAKIRFWCRPNDSKPTQSLLVRDAVDASRNPDFAANGIAGVNSRIRVQQGNPLQISCVERHSSDSAGVGSLKVSLKSSTVPSRVRHRFDPANRIATHFYEFSSGFDPNTSDAEIQFTTRTAALAGAWRIPEASVVDVTESGDVHN